MELEGAVDEEAIAELDAAMVELFAEIEGSEKLYLIKERNYIWSCLIYTVMLDIVFIQVNLPNWIKQKSWKYEIDPWSVEMVDQICLTEKPANTN